MHHERQSICYEISELIGALHQVNRLFHVLKTSAKKEQEDASEKTRSDCSGRISAVPFYRVCRLWVMVRNPSPLCQMPERG